MSPRSHRRLLVLFLLLPTGGCSTSAPLAPPEPSWLVAREITHATDDAAVVLRRGAGVRVVATRGDGKDAIGRTTEGHWFPLARLEPARTLRSSAVTPSHGRAPERPAEVAADEAWIDVDLAAQRLVAVRGDRVLRAVRISSGVGEEGAPYSTPRGTFRIYAKLRSATMASAPPAPGEPDDLHPYRFEAVPHVQYFNREIGLHGAYWHDRFGQRISHGCVNLAPADAAWLFDLTSPAVGARELERAALPGKAGTLVRVH